MTELVYWSGRTTPKAFLPILGKSLDEAEAMNGRPHDFVYDADGVILKVVWRFYVHDRRGTHRSALVGNVRGGNVVAINVVSRSLRFGWERDENGTPKHLVVLTA